MAHFTRAETIGTWINGYDPTQADMQSFDARQRSAIDGDGGGSWAPSAVLIIGGSGLRNNAPTVIAYKGTIVSGTSSPFECNDGDVPILGATHSGRMRQIVYPFALARGTPSQCWKVRAEDGGLQAFFAANIANEFRGTIVANGAVLPIRPVNGSVLVSVAIYFQVPTAHQQVPATMPKGRVFRVANDGRTIDYLTSIAAGADAAGFVSVAKPTSGDAWQNNGAMQTLAIACDQANAVDIAHYTYFIEIRDEVYGGNVWPFCATSIPRTSAVTVPMWAASTAHSLGDLIVPTVPNQNGWVFSCAKAGTTDTLDEPTWSTDTDADPVKDGSAQWTPLEYDFQFPDAIISNAPAGGYRLAGYGTIWRHALATYTGIVDTRFQ